MAEYTKVFNNPYPNGWEDLPSENTPITANALQEHTDAIENIEQYLEDNPIGQGGADVQWNQIQTDGTKIAEITIDGETTDVFAPNGGGSGGDIYEYSIENLTFNGCSYIAGGYYKIGNSVFVNLRVSLTNSQNFVISGLPTYLKHTRNNKNMVLGLTLQMTDSSSSSIYCNLRPNGELWAPLSQTNKEYGFSLFYICD